MILFNSCVCRSCLQLNLLRISATETQEADSGWILDEPVSLQSMRTSLCAMA